MGYAQAQIKAERKTANLTGVVVDPSGAVVRGATVELHSAQNAASDRATTTGNRGRYAFDGLAEGSYVVTATAEGFAVAKSRAVVLAVGTSRTVNLTLKIEEAEQQVDVPEEGQGVSTDPDSNGNAIVLKGNDIDALPLDQSELMEELQGLAGGPDAELYVNGFSGGRLPPRSSIREIRINQNPYSAQNDTNPVNGRIEIFTKPGTDKLHGQFSAYGNDSSFNSLNPFIRNEPPYHSYRWEGEVNGPINKKMSYFVLVGHRNSATNSIVNAYVLGNDLSQMSFSQAVPSPSSSTEVLSRVDMQAGRNSTLMLNYRLEREQQNNSGIGQFALASQGFDNSTTTQTLQFSNTQVIGAKVVNTTRFQYVRSRTSQTPLSVAPALVVQGAFTGGGNNLGFFRDNQDHYELQNYVAVAAGKHYLNMGARLRVARDANHSLANYDGEFIFSSLNAYQITMQGMRDGLTPAQIRAAGGGASQFNLTAGTPDVAVTVADVGVFFQDDWKVRPNLTLSYGLRYETQNHIHDKSDFGPRLGLAWSFDADEKKRPRYVLRGGAGIFYRRFESSNVLQAQRQNGVMQREYVVNQPDFYPNIPNPAELGPQASPTIYRISPRFHSPYYMQATASLERQLGGHGIAAVTYLTNRGVHTELTRNANAPLPGTYDPADPTSGVRPFGGNQNIYEYDSAGVYRSNRLMANFFLRSASNAFNLYGDYTLRFDKTDAQGGGFPSNQYDIGADYGRSTGDMRQQLILGTNTPVALGLHLYGYIIANSGAPFNIVLGQDLNGDAQFNDRPTFATDLSRPTVVRTRWGAFDTSPIAGQKVIPRNYGEGPGRFSVNLGVSRGIGFGPKIESSAGDHVVAAAAKKSAARKYRLIFIIATQNLLNHVNLAPPVGTLKSPLFGTSTAISGGSSVSANRVISLQMLVRF